jgi:hypothetical protein
MPVDTDDGGPSAEADRRKLMGKAIAARDEAETHCAGNRLHLHQLGFERGPDTHRLLRLSWGGCGGKSQKQHQK